jgi:hypothetical protein
LSFSDERGDVDKNIVENWKEKLPKLCEDYEPKNIFNMDETGVFFKDTTRKTFHIKGEDCPGGKRSKERITAAFCALAHSLHKVLAVFLSSFQQCFYLHHPFHPTWYRRQCYAFCASLTGEKLEPLIIGKSKKPRCFGKIKSENLPVMYRNNTKAWMNSLIFKEWLLKFDRKMKRQNRKVILCS